MKTSQLFRYFYVLPKNNEKAGMFS